MPISLTRAVIFETKDCGRYFVRRSFTGTGDTISDIRSAERFTNLSDFTTILPITLWESNVWDDGSKTLNDGSYGYRVTDKFWAEPVLEPTFPENPATPNVVVPASGSNIIEYSGVMHSYDFGAYLWIDPTTRNGPPTDMIFEWVSNPWEASRFTNLNEMITIMQQTELGDGPYGWGIELYVFTKEERAFSDTGNTFGIPGTVGEKIISRAFVPFSPDQGKYFYVGDPLDPAGTLQWVEFPWQGTRYTNINEFKTLIEGYPELFELNYSGYENRQFYFTQTVSPPPINPYEDFFTNNSCVQDPGVTVSYGNMYGYIVSTATIDCADYNKYFNEIWTNLIINLGIPQGFALNDPACYETWVNNQDQTLLQEWVTSVWNLTAC